jgi:formate/nitrite transporter
MKLIRTVSNRTESREFLRRNLRTLLDEVHSVELQKNYKAVYVLRQALIDSQKLAKKLYPNNDILNNLPDEPDSVFNLDRSYASSNLVAIKMRALKIADALGFDYAEVKKTAKKSMIDAYSPSEIADKVERIGVAKVKLGFYSTATLAILAGAFISLGGIYFTSATSQITLSHSFTQILGGLTFSLGLILVVVAGAELFTGNNLVVMAFASRKISFQKLLRNWSIVYAGNFVGALLTSIVLYFTNVWAVSNYQYGIRAVTIANNKVNLDFVEAFSLGILCNALVCLAIWLAMGGRNVTDKILGIIFPISAFIAVGFEHSVANMYFLPFALMIKDDPNLLLALHNSVGMDLSNLNLTGLFNNLLPVSLGNIVGGSLFVGIVYWFIYLRKGREDHI